MNKTIRITVRLTEEQYEKIKADAEKSNMKISTYMTKCSSEKEVIVIEDFKTFIHLLLKIGNNLNQAVMLCHEGKITCLDISSTKNLLIEILQTVTSTKIKKAINKTS